MKEHKSKISYGGIHKLREGEKELSMTGYYSISEFKKMDAKSMRSIIINSFKKDFVEINNILNQDDNRGNKVEIMYITNQIYKHINEISDYYNYALLKNVYHIYYVAKTEKRNIFEFIYDEYVKNEYYNICFTKASDITILFISIECKLKEREYR